MVPTRRFRAFTIVELLVVITIMVVLVTMLLPSLKSARESSRRVICLANQRQIFLASAAYVNDSKEYLPPGSNPGSGYVETRGLVSSSFWGDYGAFWRDYVGMAMDPSPNRMVFSSSRGPLWCPSGTRTGYTSASALTNPTVFDSGSYNNLGWQRSIDYALMGNAPVTDQYPYWPARSTLWWASTQAHGPRVFSMDIVCTSPNSASDQLRLARSPHQGGADAWADGMNVISVDGAGGWQNRDNVTLRGGNQSGCWQYYGGGSGWSWVMMPTRYEVLYTEWNYTFNWAPGNVYGAWNGKSAGSGSYGLGAAGLIRWP